MIVSTPWRALNVICWLVIVLVSILVLRRRSTYTFTRCTILLAAGQAITLPIVGLGFIVEPALWTLVDGGAIEIPEALAELLTPSGIFRYSLEPALLPAAVLALATAIPTTRRSRIVVCAGGAVLTLIVYDLVMRLLPFPVSVPLVFSIFCDLLGGGLAGVLVGYLSSLLLESGALTNPTLRHVSIGLTTVGTVVIVVIGIYLVFLRYLPDPVVLDVRAWDTVTFESVGALLPYSRFMSDVATGFPVSTPIGWLTGRIEGHARLQVHDDAPGQAGTERMFVRIAELVSDKADVRTPAALLAGARTRFSGQVKAGNIQIDSEPFNMAVVLDEATSPQQSDSLLMGDRLSMQPVRFTTEPNAVVLVAFGGIAESVFGKLYAGSRSSKALTISAGEGAKMKKAGIRQAIVVIRSPPTVSWHLGTGTRVEIRITLPDGNVVRAMNQPLKDKPWGGLHGVAVVVGSAEDPKRKTLVVDAGDYIVCPGCTVQLKSRGGIRETVRQVQVKGVEGRLQVGLKEYELKTRGEVFLGRGEMRAEQFDEETVRLAGRTAPVTLDGVVLSNTVWGTISSEVQGVIVGAVLTLIMG
jgi:hypothetical protein